MRKTQAMQAQEVQELIMENLPKIEQAVARIVEQGMDVSNYPPTPEERERYRPELTRRIWAALAEYATAKAKE